MSYTNKVYNNSAYVTLKTTWVIKRDKYSLSNDNTDKSKENYGAFSISAAVRNNNSCENPWYRQGFTAVPYPGVT